MTPGWLAATVVFAAIGFFIACIVAFFISSFGIYKTGRYGYKDMQPWMEQFRQFGDGLNSRAEALRLKGEQLSETFANTEETWRDTMGIIAEIQSHPLVRLARRRAGRR